jgi:hypothetical protein
MKKYISKSIFIAFAVSNIMIACKKTKTPSGCNPCEAAKNTVYFAIDWTGPIAYNSDLKKWVVNVRIPNTIDGQRTCIICTEIPDSLKSSGKIVIFSGEVIPIININ